MVWTGLHVAPHATANVFSIRCLISRELASDEACWQRNGRESFRRLHQMAALLRHLGQNLVDGELAAGTAFFFFSFSPPFLLSLPLWQNVPDLTFIKLTFDFFHTLQWGLPHTASSCHPPSPCHSANLSSQDCLPLFSMGQYLAFGGFHIMVVITNKYFKRIESFKIEFCVFSHRCLQIAKEQFVLPLGFCALSLASHPLYFCFWELWGAGFSLAVKSSWGAYWAWEKNKPRVNPSMPQ